jgi:osmotically-inducible protein OsmY
VDNNDGARWDQVLDRKPFNGVMLLKTVQDETHADQIIALAKDRIRHHSHLSVQRIWCDFSAKRLYLRGQVPSFYLKQLAQTAVSGMDGVSQVVNEIEVLW